MLREATRTSSQPTQQILPRLDSLSTLPPTSAFRLWRDANPLPNARSPWLSAFVLVAFHLEKGQVVEAVAPDTVLSEADLDAICFHAMPDSAAVGTGSEDVMYSFRVVREDGTLLLCHVLFRQAPDPANARGFFQKALVIVTAIPCLELYASSLAALADVAFSKGPSALTRAVEDVDSWPDPFMEAGHPGVLTLPLVGEIIRVTLPQSFLSSFAAPTARLGCLQEDGGNTENEDNAGGVEASSPTSVARGLSADSTVAEDIHGEGEELSTGGICASASDVVRRWPLTLPSAYATSAPFHEIDLSTALRGVHDKLWTLWELVALGEPLLVLGSTPPQTAAAVLAIVGLLHPLPFVGDWRPYFCIQDAAYSQLLRADNVADVFPDGAVFGVTNSHLIQTLKFPHVLVLPPVDGVGKARKPGLITAHRGSLHKSRHLANLLNSAMTSAAKSDGKLAAKAADVRACLFEKVTRPFLRAFDRYLVPTWGDGRAVTEEPYASDPFGRRLGLVDLDLSTFPTTGDLVSPGMTALFRPGAISKNRVRVLYERFAKGPVFSAWWDGARAAAEIECGVLHRTDLVEACVRGTGLVVRDFDRNNVEDAKSVDKVVDLCLRVQQEVRDAAGDDYVIREKLCKLLEELGRPLPEEVRASMRMSIS